MESLIRNFIKEHPENWEQLLEEKKIKVKREDWDVILNYGVDADFSDPIVREARGIIINLATYWIKCWPFTKFFNWGEPNAAEIDWNTARVQEKIDGSIIKMWHDKMWRISTMSTINADQAKVNGSGVTFGNIMRRLGFTERDGIGQNLDINNTYIFELVSPSNQVVIHYSKPMIYHIGTRNNWTGEELDVDIGIQKPKEYPLGSLEECIEAVKHLNQTTQRVIHEGFVVVDGNWNRIKIKSPEYLVAHRLKANGLYSKERILSLLKTTADINKICSAFQDMARFVRYYQWQVEEVKYQASCMIDYARALYEENNKSRKAVALAIAGNKYQAFGFKALDNDLPAEDIIKTVGVDKYVREYEWSAQLSV